MTLLHKAHTSRTNGSCINIHKSLGHGHKNLVSADQAQYNHDTIKQMNHSLLRKDYALYTKLQQSLFFG